MIISIMMMMLQAMFPCNAVGGEVVVKQGEIGENFYVIEQVPHW